MALTIMVGQVGRWAVVHGVVHYTGEIGVCQAVKRTRPGTGLMARR
jgi:hypothetical protein